MKNYYLFLLLLILFTNCQKDSSIEPSITPQQSIQTNFSVKTINLNKIKPNENLSEKINSFKAQRKSSIESQNNIIYNSDYGFSINTDFVKYVENGNYHSYNFMMTRDNPIDDKLENLVLSLNDAGGYNAYILKYDFTPQEFENLKLDSLKAKTTEYTRINFDPSFLEGETLVSNRVQENSLCIEIWTYVPASPHDGDLHGADCTCSGSSGGWVLSSSECGGNSGGDVTNHDSHPGNNGGGSNPTSGGGGSTSGGGDGGIITAPNMKNHYWDLKNFESGFLKDPELRKYYKSDSNIKNTVNTFLKQNNFSEFSQTEAKAALNFGKILGLNFQQFNWVFDYRSSVEMMEINDDLIEFSLESRTIAKMNIDANRAKTGWDFSKTGTFQNRPSLKYKATFKPNLGEVMYLLENGLVLYSAVGDKLINNKAAQWTSEVSSVGYHYIYSYNTGQFYEYKIPPIDYPNADIDFLLDAFWKGVAATARYATPLEDAIILIDGKDFDGVEQNKAATAGFMIVGLVPGGKITKAFKPITKGVGNTWKLIIKNGDKVITRTVKELTEETLQHFEKFALGTRHLIDEALRKGDFLDDEIIIEVAEEIADISAKNGRKLTWDEVKALFKRGHDFNTKARGGYRYNEVTLKGINGNSGKRLDTYIPGVAIISRKATTLSNIKPETFKKYLKELITKYPKGAEINAPIFGDIFTNQRLNGDYFLEIPLSNKTFFENSNVFQQVLMQFNVDNNVLIGIKYLAE